MEIKAIQNKNAIKYINNKELLIEINNSKMSYCWIKDDDVKYTKYHIIVNDLSEITDELIDQYLDKYNIKADPKISRDDLVYRLMTDEHIPDCPDGKLRRKGESYVSSIRTVFPPFKHYIIEDGNFVEVVRSHWEGSLSNGFFNNEKGKMTNRLARMIMLLSERYSIRGNWRGYCFDQNTEILSKRGWLKEEDLSEDDIVLSYDMNSGNMVWSSIKSIYRSNYSGEMYNLISNDFYSLITPGHRFITERGPVKVEDLKNNDVLILIGKLLLKNNTRSHKDEIVQDITVNMLNKHYSLDKLFTDNILSSEFICKLDAIQRASLLAVMLHCCEFELHNDDLLNKKIDAIMMISALCGKRVRFEENKANNTFKVIPNKSSSPDLKENSKILPISELTNLNADGSLNKVNYTGIVWCVETEHGTVFVRRNGTMYATMNSYNDEMRGGAILQLAQVALQFDESKSDNPFAFYTQIIKNSFRRTLNLEKRNQEIRDDLLTASGSAPSYTRQLENEIDQGMVSGAKPEEQSQKRGRKAKK